MNAKYLLIFALIAAFFVSAFATTEVLENVEDIASSVGLGDHDEVVSYESPETLGAIRLSAAGFAHIRNNLFGGRLKQSEVDSINAIMAGCNQHGIGDIRHAAYILATARHETGSMSPVREAFWLPESYRRTLRYYPYYGRGFVQLTWRENYQRADNILRLGGRLMKNLDLALDRGIAAQIIVRGMKDGWFTSRKLSHYIYGGTCDYYNARRIVNGLDRAQLIANYAKIFEQAFRK